VAGAKAWARKRPRTLAGWVWKGFTALAGGFVLLVLGLVGLVLVVALLVTVLGLAARPFYKDSPPRSPYSVVDMHMGAHLFRVPRYWMPYQLSFEGDQEVISFASLYYPDFSYDPAGLVDPMPPNHADWYEQNIDLMLENQQPFIYDGRVKLDQKDGQKVELQPVKYDLVEVFDGFDGRPHPEFRLFTGMINGTAILISCDDPASPYNSDKYSNCNFDLPYEDVTLRIDFDWYNLPHWKDIAAKSVKFVRAFELESKK